MVVAVFCFFWVTTSIPAIPEPCGGNRRSRTESCLSGSASVARGSPTTPVIPSAPTQCGRPLCGLWSRLSSSRWCRSPNRRTSLMGWQGDLMADALRGMGAGLFVWSLMGSESRGRVGAEAHATPCELLRPPDPCRVRRFLSRFLADSRVFSENTAVVTNPTRGATALFARDRTKPQDDASPSAA